MPSIEEQWAACEAAGGAAPGLPVAGIGLLKPGRAYDEAVRLFQPYKEIQEPFPEAREGLASLALSAQAQGRKVYILVNNRLEGSAPHSVGKIAEAISIRRSN
jgi:hypothetical protein